MDPYANDKLLAHPDVLGSLRAGGQGRLLTVHLMPQNVCNHDCEFCSYRMSGNKNADVFDPSVYLPWPKLRRLLGDLKSLGVHGIEVTGGGEPLAYPDIQELFLELARRNFAIGLVTNGTLLDRAQDTWMTRHMSWARVSIDSATAETYESMRGAPHFHRAWASVRSFADHRGELHPDFRIGVGFVLSNSNLAEVRQFVRMAKEHGADNVRLSLTFSDRHLDYFEDKTALKHAIEDCSWAKDEFDDENFTVHNLAQERFAQQAFPVQDYRRCPTKDLLCVIEGSGKVYSCCTFTGSAHGLWGNFLEHPDGFRGVWMESAERRRVWDSRVQCRVACLYRERNLAMNQLIDHPPIHTEFI